VWVALLLLAAAPAFAAAVAAAPAAQGSAIGKSTYMVIPIRGTIGKDFQASQMKAYLDQVSKLSPAIVVLDIDTTGGDIRDAEALIDAMIEARNVRFAAIVKRALSAGAAVAMTCEDLYITEGGTIGGAEASASGAADRNLAAWSIICRKAAQHGGHPTLLAEALVDPSFALTTRRQGETVIVERDGPGDILKARGRVLTFTAQEAVACGLARGIVDTVAAMGTRMGLAHWQELAAAPATPAVTAPAATPAVPAATATPAAAPVASAVPKAAAAAAKAYVIPISGPLASSVLSEAVETALADAARQKASVVIFRMNTGGGYIFVADKIISLIEKIDWATPVAFVNGDQRQALSAGAYICLSTRKIFMAPGTTIGAATPYHRTVTTPPPNNPTTTFGFPQNRPFVPPTSSGSKLTVALEIEEKMMSVFRARFRGLAQTRGYPPALAEAMVDGKTTIVEVFIDGKQDLVSDEEARRLESSARPGGGKFQRGRTVNSFGKLITLTSQEALDYKLCAALVNNEKELTQAMGIENCTVVEATWLPQWVEKTDKERRKKVEDLISYYFAQGEQVNAAASTMATRSADSRYGYGAINPTDQRRLRDKCFTSLKECAKAVTELEKLAKDPKYQDYIHPQTVEAMKRSVEGANAQVSNM
jgi:membrane-bound ClpP family serine protease